MIRYALHCAHGHDFEGWFGSSADYDEQRERGLLRCPECDSPQVDKAIMAPSVRRNAAPAPDPAALREAIAANCDDVGDTFADEARAMFYGDKPARAIYGQATPGEARELHAEGIPAVPLPPALDPKRAPEKLN